MSNHPELDKLLRTQFGIVTCAQVLGAGLSERTIRRARTAGAFSTVLPGVLQSAEHQESFESRAMAVQLYVAASGALSGPTAGRLYGLRNMPVTRLWARATKPTRARLPSWLALETSTTLLADPHAVRNVGCWRLLAPAQTLLTSPSSSTIIVSSELPRTPGTSG